MEPYRAAIEAACVFDLSSHGQVDLVGPEARGFLHNLCTQDVKNLQVGATAEAFLTTTKARVVAHVWITPTSPENLRLDMVAGQNAKVVQHLNHYLISEQVEIIDRTQEQGLLQVVGPIARDRLQALGMAQARPQRLLALPGFDLWVPITDLASLWQRLTENGVIAGDPQTYQALRVEAGLPEYGIDIDENRLAMEVGRTPQAISYNKGCYLGQETIVMARDRGQANRTLMGLKLQDGPPLLAGAKVLRGSDEVGQVTSSVESPRLGQVIALAYLRRGSWDPGTEVSVEGRTAIVCALPFVQG